MYTFLNFVVLLIIYSEIMCKPSEDEILPHGFKVEIYNGSEADNLPDYSIIHQIDIFKNKSVSNEDGKITIIDDSGIPKPKGIKINIPNQKVQIHRIRVRRQNHQKLLNVYNH